MIFFPEMHSNDVEKARAHNFHDSLAQNILVGWYRL
jgi:hypothetical protein